MFEKLVWEHALMRNAYGKSRREQTYLALNAAMTAWHMCDWLCAAFNAQHYKRLTAQFDSPIDNCKVFRKFVLQRPMLAMCEAVAVAGKHFVFSGKQAQISTRFAVLSESLDVPIVEDGTSSVPAPTMVSLALRFWAEILITSGLATEEEVVTRVMRGERGD